MSKEGLKKSVITKVRKLLRKNSLLRKINGHILFPSGLFDNMILKYQLSSDWEKRVKHVLESEDNQKIPRVPEAGLIKRGKQTMHNGIKINLGSYYGPEYSKLLFKTKGVHEPQEERVFGMVLPLMKEGATMIEMGAFWSFYSMWFHKEVKNAKNYMIEPDKFNLESGTRNFTLNNMQGNFTNAFIGKEEGLLENTKIVSVDSFINEKNIHFVDILHSDIQGFEYEMLLGAEKTISTNKVGYIFISTHSNEIHFKCLNHLESKNFIIICEANLDQSFSEDGLIVARAPYYDGIEKVEISKRIK